MWELYDELISGIPEELTVSECCAGHIWTAVKTENTAGVAMSMQEMSRPPMHQGSFRGERLKKMAECVKSWNFSEAGLGLAAINAWYNSTCHADVLGAVQGKTRVERDAFLTYQQEITGKKVAVIGHFPFLETRFAPICTLSILERAPKDGDYPDSACEYLLKEQDYVFITGVTLINKTLPRLLELSKSAKVILVGPSVPMAPCLFKFGVSALESFVVEQPEKCVEMIGQSSAEPLFAYGRMVSLTDILQEEII